MKNYKANLLENGDPLLIESMRNLSAEEEQGKVMLRIDRRTHILVTPSEATPEHAEKLRRKYVIGNCHKGGRKRDEF